MAAIKSTRELHTELDQVCRSLEAVFRLAGRDHEELEDAAAPALVRFRELLDEADRLIPTE